VLRRRLEGLDQHRDHLTGGVEARREVQHACRQRHVVLGLQGLLGLEDAVHPASDLRRDRRDELEDRTREDRFARQPEAPAADLVDLEDDALAVDVGEAEAARPEKGAQPLSVQVETSIVLGHGSRTL
jgi:hypothetical protein